jgi:O-antigen/teichoic acid export membrane protein
MSGTPSFPSKSRIEISTSLVQTQQSQVPMKDSMRYTFNILKVLAAIIVPGAIYVWLVSTFAPGFSDAHPWLTPIVAALCVIYGQEVMCRNDLEKYRNNSILHYSTKREKIQFIALLTAMLIIMGLAMELIRDTAALAIVSVGVIAAIVAVSYFQKRKANRHSTQVT